MKEKAAEEKAGKGEPEEKDDFFGDDSDDDEAQEVPEPVRKKGKGKTSKGTHTDAPDVAAAPRAKATAEELALIAASDNPNGEPKHFDMKAVIKAEKGKGKKRERDIVKVKEEPPAVSLSEHGPVTSFVSIRYLCYSFCTGLSSCPT